MRIIPVLLLAAACGLKTPPTPPEAAEFVDRAERELKQVTAESDRADWVQSTYITDDTEWLAARRTEQVMELRTDLIEEARRFGHLALSPELERKLMLLITSPTIPAP